MRQHKRGKIVVAGIGIILSLGALLFFGKENMNSYQKKSVEQTSFKEPKVKFVANEDGKHCFPNTVENYFGGASKYNKIIDAMDAVIDSDNNIEVTGVPYCNLATKLAIATDVTSEEAKNHSDVVCNAFNNDKTCYYILPVNVLFSVSPMLAHSGDVNGDGHVGAEDWLNIMQATVGLIQLNYNQILAADVDVDGRVSASDALELMQTMTKYTPTSCSSSNDQGTIEVNNSIWANVKSYLSSSLSKQIQIDIANSKLVFSPNKDYTFNGDTCHKDDFLFYKTFSYNAAKIYSNIWYNDPICVNFRNEYGNEFGKQLVPYCFSETVDTNFGYSRVKKWVDIAKSAYKARNDALSNSTASFTTYPNEVNVENPSQKISLACNPFTFDETELVDVTKYDQAIKDVQVNQYANVSNTYSHITEKMATHGYCKTACKEIAIVKFQAPVAVQAGMCFTYQVEVESKMECNASETAKANNLKIPDVCIPSASCNGLIDHDNHSAGPTEEFDACIQSCDKGKYSQKCINTCYKKVYEDASRVENMLSYADKISNAYKIANTSCLSGYNHKDEQGFSAPTFDNALPMDIYKFRLEDHGGSYVQDGSGIIKWEPSGTCPSPLGYWWYKGLDTISYSLPGFRNSFYDRINRHFIVDDNGFRKQWNDYFQCDATCKWKTNGCTPKLPNEAADEYDTQLNNYYSDWKECSSQLKNCSDTTTTYTITVDQDNPASPNHTEYKQEQKPGQEPSDTFVNSASGKKNIKQNGILIDYSGSCYGIEDGWVYRNVLRFPETFLANKNGLYTNLVPKNTGNYQWMGNQFCTSTKTKDVNISWYDWKVNQNADTTKITDALKTAVEKERQDNINVHIGSSESHFWGQSGWNFDVNCFYAVADPECPCGKKDGKCIECPPTECPCGEKDDGTCKVCIDTETTTTIASDYMFRPVDLNDLFPNGRNARFNWSCDATNLLNSDYPVQPEGAIDQIESKGNSIYSDDAELDYDIFLNRDTMKKVREYNMEHKIYTDYDGQELLEKENTSGVPAYKSDFITKVLGENVHKRGLIGCNNQRGSACDTQLVQNNCMVTWKKGA